MTTTGSVSTSSNNTYGWNIHTLTSLAYRPLNILSLATYGAGCDFPAGLWVEHPLALTVPLVLELVATITREYQRFRSHFNPLESKPTFNPHRGGP